MTTEPPTRSTPSAGSVCACGHGRHHDAVQPILGYGWRWLAAWLLDTAAGPPREVRFVCAVCDAEVGRARDRETLRQYGRWPRVDRAALRAGSGAVG